MRARKGGMTSRLSGAACAGLVALAGIGACSGGSLDTEPVGGLGQLCPPTGKCSAGLTCLSHHCVSYAPPPVDAGHADTGVPLDPPVSVFAQAHCAKLIACYGVSSGFVNAKTCVARKTLELTDALGAPGSGWTSTALSDCAAVTRAATCAEFWAGVPCLQQAGSRPNGATCIRAAQCRSFACAAATDGTCGACAIAKSAGSVCTTSNECGFHLVCSNAFCVAPGSEGTPCDVATQLCAFGLSCRNAVCAQAGPDALCSATDQDCQTNDFCSSVTNRCERDSYAGPGAVCGWVNGDASRWVDCVASPGRCLRGTQQLAGVCPQIAADGQTCDGTNVVCTPPSACVQGKCAFPRAAGCQ